MSALLHLVIQFTQRLRASIDNKVSVSKKRSVFRAKNSNISLLSPCRKYQKYIAQIMLASYLSAPGVLLAGGATAAVNSVHAPNFDTAGNGVPIVNINAPSSKGVSRNEYDQLNVNSAGLIFNNATDIVKTQLAGFIDGNSNLNGRNANIILNEVMGNSRSALNGYMEIAGQSAELIIANQNGITCNGCGFINTTRGVLTTGQAIFDGAGGLSGFDISRGDVDITGLGLNASNIDEVDILARSVTVNSEFWAKKSTIITGDNIVDYDDRSVTSRSTSDKSGYSLDVAAIGGMYANRITLIGTEKGLGVNFDGDVSATESMTLDSQGNLINNAKLSSKALTVSVENIENSSQILGDNITLEASNLTNSGSSANIQATKALTLTLQNTLSNQNGAKVQTPNGQIAINATTINNESTIAANQLTISANELNNSTDKGEVYGTEKVDLTLTGQLNNTDNALLQSDDQLVINASGDIFNNNATLASIGTATINSKDFINTGEVIAQNNHLTITASLIDNQGSLKGSGITIDATDLSNSTVNGKIYSYSEVDLNLTGGLVNEGGALVHADTDITLDADDNITNTSSTIEAANSVDITSENVTNSGTVLAQGDTLTVRTQQLNNLSLLGGKNIDIEASGLNNNTSSSQIYGNESVRLVSTDIITNSNGALIHAGENLILTSSGDLINNSSTIESAINATLTSQNFFNSENSISLAQNGSLILNTGVLDNDGTLTGKDVSATASVINNQKTTSQIESTNDLTLLATNGNVNNSNGASIRANNALVISATGDLVNSGASIESNRNIDLSSRNLTNSDSAKIVADNSITLKWTGNLMNNASSLEAKNNINTSQRSGSLNNTSSGMITAQSGTLDIDLGSLNNQGGIGANRIELETSGVTNYGSNALIVANDYLDIRSTNNIDNNDGAVLYSLGAGYLQANNTITNSSARIETRNDLTIHSNSLINKKRQFSVGYSSTSTTHNNVGIGIPSGYYDAKRNYTRTVTTPYISADSAQGYILSGGNMSIISKIDNIYSTVSAVGSLSFDGALNNQSYSARTTTVQSGTDYLYRSWKDCERNWYGKKKCKTKYETDTRGYNSTNYSTSNLASATFTSGKNITGKAEYVRNSGGVSDVNSGNLNSRFPNEGNEGVSLSKTDQETIKNLRETIFSNVIDSLIGSALFRTSSNHNYFIETNPLLTNYENFISSDYLLNKLISNSSGGDVELAMRLGDGFLEQQLVRDQILSFTGKQTIPDSVSIEDTYSALMDNAVDSYEDLQLTPGVELTFGQIAKLQKPIVWMVEETIDTPTGPQQALVPKVYFSDTSGLELRADGSLMAGSSIDLDVENGITNSGSMLATVDLSLKAGSIDNAGSLKSQGNLSLVAGNDIVNSGTVQAVGALNLDAGGSIISETKTTVLNHQSDGHSSTETLVGNTASLQGGSVSLTAGKDISLIGSDLNATENVFVDAGNNFTLASLKITNSSKDGDHSSHSTTKNQVSSLSGNNIQINAGNTFTSEGANIDASGDLGVSATNIDLLAVIDTEDNYSKVGSGNNYTKTSSHNESVNGSSLSSGGNLSLVASNDIYSEGTAVAAEGNLALAAGNDVILTTVTAVNTSSSETKKKTSGFWGSKTKVTSSSSEAITNQGTSLASGGNVSISSGNDTILIGSTAQAEGSIAVDAGGEVLLLSAVDQTSESSQSEKKGTFKVKTTNSGSIAQTAVGSGFIAQGDVSIQSDENITFEGATLASGETLSLAAGGNDAEAVTQNAQGDYVNADGNVVGNITLGTQALQNSEWSESSSSYRGIAKDLVKAVSAVAATVGIKDEIKIGEAHATRRDAITHESTSVQSNDLNIDAQNDVTLISTDILVADNATINANNVIIDAAEEKTIVSESHTSKTISSAGASYNSDTGEATLVSLTETDQTERTTTTDTTWSGSTINAGNLTINADENVAIIASDINVENNASIEAENILVGGREDTSNTTTDSITKTETLTVGVKNAYVDVVLAAKALDAAKDAVGDAKNAYDEAKQKVAEGKLPKSDLEFYKINLAAAQVGVANATLGVTSAGAAAAASTATYGFTATAGTSTQTDKTSTSITQGTWSGSSINVGGNTSLTSENNLTVEGSSVNTAGELNLDAQNINVIAGTNTYSESTESSSAGASATVSTGGNFGGSVNASSSSSENQSTNYVNSSLSGGSIVSNSDSLTIAGGNLNGGEIDITTDTLVVTSLQDTSSSSNESQGGNVGFGGSSSTDSKTGKSSTSGSLSSIGINASQGESSSAWVNQQSGITGGTVNIKAKDTSITGATIAAVDENGNTTDNLTLTTDTLTVANLEDTDTSKQMGIDLSTGSGSTTIGGNFSGHEKEQLTKATIGLGNVTVGGESIDEQAEFADLNRDVATSQEITKDMERGGLDASLTVDHRLLTEAGRDKISEDIMKSGMLVDTAVLAATTERVSLLDFNEELGKTHTVYETVKTEIAKDEKLAGKLQDPNLSAADKEIMLDQLTKTVMTELGYETEGYENKIIADKTAVGSYEDGTGGKVAGFHSDETRDSYINDVNIDSTSQLVNAGGHESSHEMDAQDGITYSQSDNEAYANNFGGNLASYTNLALDINGYDSGMATTNNHVGNSSEGVLANTKEYNALDKEQGDNMALRGLIPLIKDLVLPVAKVTKKIPKDPPVQQMNPKNLIPTQTKNEISGSQVKRLKKDMQNKGFDQSEPIDVVKNYRGRLEIEDGHHRTEAAIKAGLDKVPVRVWEE